MESKNAEFEDDKNIHLYSLECRLTVLALRSASIRAISGVVRVTFLPATSNDDMDTDTDRK